MRPAFHSTMPASVAPRRLQIGRIRWRAYSVMLNCLPLCIKSAHNGDLDRIGYFTPSIKIPSSLTVRFSHSH